MQKLSYRKAALADLAWLVETEQQCFGEVDAFSRRTIRYMIKNPHDSIILDVLEQDQKPVGYAVYITRRNSKLIRFYSLCLLPAYRGQGLLKPYLQERLKGFAERYKRIGLEVRVSNLNALQLYRTLGFKIEKTLPQYYPSEGNGEDGYRMEVILT